MGSIGRGRWMKVANAATTGPQHNPPLVRSHRHEGKMSRDVILCTASILHETAGRRELLTDRRSFFERIGRARQ